jgi:hypothetical protein
MLTQEVVTTRFPTSLSVVGVLVDRDTQAVPAPPDAVIIHIDGATSAPLPLQVAAGNRTVYLYDIVIDTADGAQPPSLSVTVGLRTGLSLAGVLGAPGTASGWAAALAGSTLTQIVPDEQLTADGELRARLQQVEVTHG